MAADPAFAGQVVTAAQARAAGADHVAVRRARRRGELVRLSRGLDLTSAGDTDLGRLRAALSVSPDAVLSGASVARLADLTVPREWPDEITLSPDVRRVRSRPGLRVVVRPVQPVVLRGLPSTSLARAVADIACGPRPEPQQWIVDQALHRGVDPREVAAHLAYGQRGVRTARRALEVADALSESPLESAVGLVLSRYGLPRPVRQHPLDGGRIRLDLAWPLARLAVEADGVGFHSDPLPLYRDRERQNRLMRLDWIVLRCTWADLRRDHAGLAALAGQI
ncbi:MAG: endonuclease domain-containing protein, partial [Mycobacteriales bacterium]